MIPPWWERIVGRLEFEIAELQEAGAHDFAIDKNPQSGTAILDFVYPVRNTEFRLRVIYPPTYPNTRFEIVEADGSFERHQNPLGRNLCLLGRAPDAWDPQFTVARVLESQLVTIIEINANLGDSELRRKEDPQAEPATSFFPYPEATGFVVSSDWNIPDALSGGMLKLGVTHVHNGPLLKGVVLQVLDSIGNVLAECSPKLKNMSFIQTLTGTWRRAPELPKIYNAKDFCRALGIESGRFYNVGGEHVQADGVLTRTEVEHQKFGDAWMFAVRFQRHRAGFRDGKYWDAYFARGMRYGDSDYGIRVPAISVMRKKKIALVGAGCLGSAAVLEFARLGVDELRLMDFDFVEPATTVRWVLGFNEAGWNKVKVLQAFVSKHYPLTTVRAYDRKFGGAEGFMGASGSEIDEFLSGVDLVYDACIDGGANDALAEIARNQGIPYVCVSATPGAWGGRVVCVRPQSSACWDCYLYARSENNNLIPPSAPDGLIAPVGCDEPTFTGANYDLQEVTLMGVRVAVAALANEAAQSWDVGVLDFDRGCTPPIPRWTQFRMTQHPKCQNH